jgi:hypothetical protein
VRGSSELTASGRYLHTSSLCTSSPCMVILLPPVVELALASALPHRRSLRGRPRQGTAVRDLIALRVGLSRTATPHFRPRTSEPRASLARIALLLTRLKPPCTSLLAPSRSRSAHLCRTRTLPHRFSSACAQPRRELRSTAAWLVCHSRVCSMLPIHLCLCPSQLRPCAPPGSRASSRHQSLRVPCLCAHLPSRRGCAAHLLRTLLRTPLRAVPAPAMLRIACSRTAATLHVREPSCLR